MNDANVEVIRRVNDIVASGDTTAVAATLHPDVVWEHNIGVGTPEEGVYEGREAVVRLFERIIEPWQFLRPEPADIRDLGDGIYEVTGTLHAKHSTSEMLIVARYEQRLHVRNGVLVKGEMTTGDLETS